MTPTTILEAVIDGLLRGRDSVMAEQMFAHGHDFDTIGLALDLQHRRDAKWRAATLKRWREQHGSGGDPIKKLRAALSEVQEGA